MMPRYSGLWWASILLSSVALGGGSAVLLIVLTELPIQTVIKLSLVLTLAGDVVLALLMEAVSPTRVTLGPGERSRNTELPRELGVVIKDFKNGHGSVAIRGERWRARQSDGCSGELAAGATVRVLERDGLMLIVAATEQP